MFKFFSKKNRHLAGCMSGVAVCLAENYGRPTADLIAGQFCNDYHELYDLARSRGLEGVHCNIFVATEILPNIARELYLSDRSNFLSSTDNIDLVCCFHTALALSIGSDGSRMQRWQADLNIIFSRSEELGKSTGVLLKNSFSQSFLSKNTELKF